MLAGCYVTNLDPAKAAPIDPELEAYLSDPANHVPPLERGKAGRNSDGGGSYRIDGDVFHLPLAEPSPPESRVLTPPPSEIEAAVRDEEAGDDSQPPASALPEVQ